MLDHLDEDDPLGPWSAELADGAIDVSLSGHLTGSIDLIMQGAGRTGGRTVSSWPTTRPTG